MTQNFSYAAEYSPPKYTSHFPTYIYEPRKIFYCPRLGCQNDRTEAQLMLRHTSRFPTYIYEPRKRILYCQTWVSAGHDRGTVIVETVFAHHNFHSQGLCLVLTYFQGLKTGLLRSEDWSTFMDSATLGHSYMLICQKTGRVQCLCNFFLLWGWEWQIPRHAVVTFSGVQV